MQRYKMAEIIIGNCVIPYTVRTSPQSKRLTIHLTPNDMEVVVPESTSEDRILSFVKKKRNWIYEKREELLETALKQEQDSLVHYRTGAKILYRGRRVKLYIERTGGDQLSIRYRNGFYIQVPVSLQDEYNDEVIESALTDWMKERIRQDCESFSRKYENLLGLQSKGIRIKGQKHLWGSCGHDQILNFNWRLVKAPKQVLEYVVAHEVCHLKYRNHSDEFWGLLRSVFSEIEICRKWLEKSADMKQNV